MQKAGSELTGLLFFVRMIVCVNNAYSSSTPVLLPKDLYSSGVYPVIFLNNEKKCSVEL